MALPAFPFSLADFWDQAGVRTVTWVTQENTQLSGMGSGQILESDLAPSLRVADVMLRQFNANESSFIEARIEALRLYKENFLAYDPRKCVPREDPYGNILGAAVPSIRLLPNAKTIALQDFPPGYILRAGDCISWQFGVTPVRWAYHRLLEDAVANSLGDTDAFAVSPFIMAGSIVGTPVDLIRPRFKAMIKPGSIDINNSQLTNRTNISFSLVQKI